MKHVWIIFSLFLSFDCFAQTGFEAGSEYKITTLYGDLELSCRDGSQSANVWHRCVANLIDPNYESPFVTDFDIDADHVALASKDEEGKIHKNDEKFYPATRKSKSFNLLISGLFQKALLRYGVNEIHYALTKDGHSVREGDFSATVKKEPALQCRYGFYYSFNMADCKSPERFCWNYFREHHYCQ